MFNLGAQSEDDWRKQAECYNQRESVQELNALLGYDMFYPETGKTEEAYKYSQRFCRTCTVQVACFTAGINEQGTWGGETYSKRRQMVRTLGTSLSKLQTRLMELSQDENKDRIEELSRDPESA